MNRAATLEELARLCRRDGVIPATIEPSGLAALDAVLPHGGWQSGTIVELLPADIGIGELRILMPALARITHKNRHVALIAPPHVPLAAALEQHGIRLERLLIIQANQPTDILWACEQTLRCKSFGAVLAWPSIIRDRDVRRLQLAAEAGRSTGFLYRPPTAVGEASPAAVRLKLRAGAEGQLHIDILKCRGARSGISLVTNQKQRASASSPQPPAFSLQPRS